MARVSPRSRSAGSHRVTRALRSTGTSPRNWRSGKTRWAAGGRWRRAQESRASPAGSASSPSSQGSANRIAELSAGALVPVFQQDPAALQKIAGLGGLGSDSRELYPVGFVEDL